MRADSSYAIDLSFVPAIEIIPVTRRFVSELYATVIPDRDAISRIGLTVHEMLENAMRYATGTEMRVRIEIERAPVSAVVIQTWNQTNKEHRVVVERLFEEMSSAPDPFIYYCGLMKRNAKLDGSGLGLARIQAEAEMQLTYRFTESLLCVAARGNVELRA